jgi:two-component system KDP operon response regulator KdpE
MPSILLIEDDDRNRQLLHAILETEGHRVSLASTGFEGYKQFRIDPSDIVIANLLTAEHDGLDVIVGIRREFPDARIIGIAGGIRPRSGFHAAQLLGARCILWRPVGRDALLHAVREALAQ